MSIRTQFCVYKTLNSILKKGFHILVHIVTQLRLNVAWVTRFFDLFPIREEIISREMTICYLYGRSLYGRRTVPHVLGYHHILHKYIKKFSAGLCTVTHLSKMAGDWQVPAVPRFSNFDKFGTVPRSQLESARFRFRQIRVVPVRPVEKRSHVRLRRCEGWI